MPIIRSSVLLLACVVFSQLLSGLLIPHKTSAPPGRNFFRHIVPYGRRPDKQTIGWRNQVALKNIFSVPKHIEITDNSLPYDLKNSRKKRATSPRDLSPGDPAPAFSIVTTEGSVRFPQKPLGNSPIIIHTFDKRSGFLEALWNSANSLDALIRGPANGQYVFLSTSPSAFSDAHWMRKQVVERMVQLKVSQRDMDEMLKRMHFGTTPAFELGNWIPDLLKEWRCEDHNCGYYQAVFQMETSSIPLSLMNGKLQPVVSKRQDARYDWLPNMFVGFGSRPTMVVYANSGCERAPLLQGKIALVTDGTCSYYKKVRNMQQSGSLGVIVVANIGQPIHDMNCAGGECSSVLTIPATMVPYDERLVAFARQGGQIFVRFQTTQSDNFYVAVDRKGRLQEMGWLLYPSFSFFTWQIEGMEFIADLEDQIAAPDVVINVYNRTKMHGDEGAFAPNVALPWDGQRVPFSKLTLDWQLRCPHPTDRTCAEWDHTVHLFVCCDQSPLCGMELGRTISPYRKQAGRWLTDATHLLPLLTNSHCNFTMKHPPWTDAWYPILNLRFGNPQPWLRGHQAPGNGPLLYPDQIEPMFVGSETFDLTYNTKFPVFAFLIPSDVRRVMIYAIITGHGSDNNNCAEFCVTSHNMLVNEVNLNSRVFTNAGTPLGCANRVRHGVEPNQHGTWLYGRNGWCPGENVVPWIVDITEQVRFDRENHIRYYGQFNNSDPNPTSNPGNIIISAYLSLWKEVQPASQTQPYRKIILPGLGPV